MFVFRNVLLGTATVLDYVLWLYMWIIIARALISWVNPDPWNPIVQFLDRATEPVLAPIPRWMGWRIYEDHTTRHSTDGVPHEAPRLRS